MKASNTDHARTSPLALRTKRVTLLMCISSLRVLEAARIAPLCAAPAHSPWVGCEPTARIVEASTIRHPHHARQAHGAMDGLQRHVIVIRSIGSLLMPAAPQVSINVPQDVRGDLWRLSSRCQHVVADLIR